MKRIFEAIAVLITFLGMIAFGIYLAYLLRVGG